MPIGNSGGIWRVVALATLAFMPPSSFAAQQPPEAESREAIIEREKAEKATMLHPYEPDRAEALMARAESILLGGGLHWHPFFNSAYAGGGFTVGGGYMQYVSPYNFVDVRGSITVSDYKRVEAQFTAPRLFERHASLSLLGGWRQATQVGFFGIGPNTLKSSRTNYSFKEPYAAAMLTVAPTRKLLLLQGGFELSQWKQESGRGNFPSVETVFTPASLPGLGAKPTYAHSEATFGIDWRTSPGYSRRGGFYGVTAHDYHDTNSRFGFRQVDYDAIQHIPILREAWVVSLHGRLETTYNNGTQQIPFFMLPSLGGGSTLRGFTSWRFRDRNSLLLQAEWRAAVNRFMDLALFYDTGKVTPSRGDIDLRGLKDDYGVGVRLHGPISTPLRIEVARSNEGTRVVFAASSVF
jgi:hypothetical protein